MGEGFFGSGAVENFGFRGTGGEICGTDVGAMGIDESFEVGIDVGVELGEIGLIVLEGLADAA